MVMPARENQPLDGDFVVHDSRNHISGDWCQRTIDNQQIAVVNTRIDHGIAGHLHNKQRGLVRHGL